MLGPLRVSACAHESVHRGVMRSALKRTMALKDTSNFQSSSGVIYSSLRERPGQDSFCLLRDFLYLCYSVQFPDIKTKPTIEVNLQKALAEASETCTQECLILGHSDSCWMPPALTQFQTSGAATLPSFGFQQSWARGTKPDGRHTLGRSVPKDDLDKGSNRPQFYNTLERHCSKKEDPVKVIPLASFSATSSPQTSMSGSAFLHEHQL
ncbi:Protocadherin-9 [Anabarilius grahami]|uniref:Protocadherin-9 n=1 Tax=Anabarilius grahami TaxID=495550 RepID=A0A3N0YNK8_ANAGA|nr:Protocadherin-9 [Anabarilius grahami]